MTRSLVRSLALLALLAPAGAQARKPRPLPDQLETLTPLAFRPDGSLVAEGCEDVGDYTMRSGNLVETVPSCYLLQLDARGQVLRLIRKGPRPGGHLGKGAEQPARAAELGALPKAPPEQKLEKQPVTSAGPGGATVSVAPLAPAGDEQCATAATWSRDGASLTLPLGPFACPGEVDAVHTDFTAAVLWNADGSRAALVLTQTVTQEMNGEGSVGSPTLAFLSPRDLARVDLLDARAGKRTAAFRAAAEKAGFTVAHAGKTKDKHEATEVFAAPGYEAAARELALATGLDPAAVKALTWKSSYPIVVALTAK